MKYLPIALVERESGISKDALRVWERRYGFPSPGRDENGVRVYAPDQIQKLKLIRQLIERGNRPAKLVAMGICELQALIAGNSSAPQAKENPLVSSVLDLLKSSAHAELVNLLTQRLASDGLVNFVIEHMAPLNVAIGHAWAQGRISIAQEHLYTEIMQKILRAHLLNVRQLQTSPKVLLATLSGEQHGLGLLMVECVISGMNVTPVSLGTEVPVVDIANAAASHRCDAVAVSFSRARSPSFVSQGVKALREEIDPSCPLWIGGEGASWMRHNLNGVQHLRDLRALQEHLSAWKSLGHS